MVNRIDPDTRYQRALDLGILVDPQDEWLLFNFSWRVVPKGYVETTMYADGMKLTVKLHHFIVGRPIDGTTVDHADRNKLNNKRDNLFYRDRFYQALNRDYVSSSSNIRITAYGKFEVRVCRNGITKQVGTFDSEEIAVRARDEYLERYTGVLSPSDARGHVFTDV